MKLGIDASNIRAGGGVTHLVELLRAAAPLSHGFSQVIVWSIEATLDRIEDRPWLIKKYVPMLDKGFAYRTFWQCFKFSKEVRYEGCTILYVPGGSYMGNFYPLVTFSQNLLPFEWNELKRYGWSLFTIKMLLLRLTQSNTFHKADGVIFLTKYAQKAVMRVVKKIDGVTSIVAHGIDKRFNSPPREQYDSKSYSFDKPFRLLYVSVIDHYKHQWHVADAVAQLRKSGLPLDLDLVGPASHSALKRLQEKLTSIDPTREFLHYSGPMPYSELHTRYSRADAFVFASSCETFGQILIEAMSAGLPIACSNRSAMPELLGDAGVYFNPESPLEIANAIRLLFENPDLRFQHANNAFEKVQKYSWKQCAEETFSFIARIAYGK